jgi:fructose/tagatose bisphosphate aldolase
LTQPRTLYALYNRASATTAYGVVEVNVDTDMQFVFTRHSRTMGGRTA